MGTMDHRNPLYAFPRTTKSAVIIVNLVLALFCSTSSQPCLLPTIFLLQEKPTMGLTPLPPILFPQKILPTFRFLPTTRSTAISWQAWFWETIFRQWNIFCLLERYHTTIRVHSRVSIVEEVRPMFVTRTVDFSFCLPTMMYFLVVAVACAAPSRSTFHFAFV